jgi:RNA polymerase sigma-70 factor (ECF subfamily)
VGRLYDEYGAMLYRYALMILADRAGAEDVLHHVFTRLLTHPRDLQDEAPYLRRAVRNECYSTLRRRVRAAAGPLLDAIGPDDRPEERLALESAIRQLPADQREVLHLHSFEGLTFREIGELLNESINTVSSRYRYGVGRLRQILK